MSDDRHDQTLDDLSDAGWDWAPDGKLLDTIRGAGFRITLPGADDGDGYNFIVTRDAPPLVFSLPPMGLRAWWRGWWAALFAAHQGAMVEIAALTTERDALRRLLADDRGPARRRRGLRW